MKSHTYKVPLQCVQMFFSLMNADPFRCPPPTMCRNHSRHVQPSSTLILLSRPLLKRFPSPNPWARLFPHTVFHCNKLHLTTDTRWVPGRLFHACTICFLDLIDQIRINAHENGSFIKHKHVCFSNHRSIWLHRFVPWVCPWVWYIQSKLLTLI